MKANRQRFIWRVVMGLVAPTVLSLSVTQAAEAVRWDDLAKKIGHARHRQYRVITKAGTTYAGHDITFSTTAIRLLDTNESIPREQVEEIRIHRDRRLSDALLAPAVRILEGGLFFACKNDEELFLPVGVIFAPVVLPVALASIPAAAPIVLPIEGVKRLLPDKMIRLAP